MEHSISSDQTANNITIEEGLEDNRGDALQQEFGRTLNGIQVLKRIGQLASKTEQLTYLAGIICSIGSGTILPLMTLIFGNFVGVFTDFSVGSMEPEEFRSKVSHYTLYFVYLFIAKLGLSYLSMASFTIISTRVTVTLRRRYLNALLHRNISFYETSMSSGAVSLGLSTHCNTIQSGLAEKFGLSLQSVSQVIAAFIVAFTSQWKLGLVTATIIPATVVIVGAAAAWESKMEESINTINADAATLAEEILGSIRTVRALGATDKLLKTYRSYLDRAKAIGWRISPITGFQAATYMFMIYAAYALAFWYGIRLYSKGEVHDAGRIITTLFAIIVGTNAFTALATYLGPFLRIFSAAAELFRIIDRNPESPLSRAGRTTNQERFSFDDSGGLGKDIEFDNVSFHYPLRPNVNILSQFCLKIPADKTIAFVGPSGSGKSTIVALLERWYDVNEGTIRIGGKDMAELPLDMVRGRIGLVQQEPFMFGTTILENILYGLADHGLKNMSDIEKRDKVIEACKIANAHEFITKLPKGYDTFVGDRGTLISGGQKQRLAIARAIISNPSILILDEATSALDPASERLVQHALARASKGRTTIAIAHRLSTIRDADTIVVLDKGSIVEKGTHDELSSIENGTYDRLLGAQMLNSGSHIEAEADQESECKLTAENAGKLAIAESVGGDNMDISEQEIKARPSSGLWKAATRTMSDQRQYLSTYIVLLICCVIGGAMFPLQAYLYAKVISAFQLTGENLVRTGNFWALMFFVLAIAVGLAYFGVAAIGAGFGGAIEQFYRFSYISSMLEQPISFFDSSENSPGILVSRLATDPDAMKSLAGANLGTILIVVISLLSTVILSLSIGWKLALVAIFGALPLIFGAALLRERMEQNFSEKAIKTFSGSVGFASECMSALRTVNSLCMEGLVEQKFGDLLQEHSVRTIRYALLAMLWFALSESIDFLCMGLTFWYGGRLLSFHEYNTTQFFVVFVAIVLGAQSTGMFLAHASDISKGASSANTIFSLQQTVSKSPTVKKPLPAVDDLPSDTPLIEFRNARFAYPSQPNHPVLKGLDMTLYRGQSIALVGPSGCGKSTTIGLLERFYDLNQGQILINGVDVNDVDVAAVRKRFSLVSQEPTLYQGTIRDNILLSLDSNTSDSDLDTIAKKAQIYDTVASLTQGYNTRVGSRGSALSGGQKQRIAIARAIATDADILLLDEATSALDSESERLVQEALKESGKGKSVISIAHRLSTIQHSDIIYVLDEGVVAEKGSHSELWERRGIYYHMVLSQTGGAN